MVLSMTGQKSRSVPLFFPDFAGIFGVIELPCENLCILNGSLTALNLRGR